MRATAWPTSQGFPKLDVFLFPFRLHPADAQSSVVCGYIRCWLLESCALCPHKITDSSPQHTNLTLLLAGAHKAVWYLAIYAGISGTQTLLELVRIFAANFLAVRAARALHNGMLARLLRYAPSRHALRTFLGGNRRPSPAFMSGAS